LPASRRTERRLASLGKKEENTMKIRIDPDNIRAFQNIDRGERRFCCLLSRDILERFDLSHSHCYLASEVQVFESSAARLLLQEKNYDVLVIVNDGSLPVIQRDTPIWKGMDRTTRAIEIPLFSTGVPPEFLPAYVESLYLTNPQDFNERVDSFFSKLEISGQLRFVNRTFKTELDYRCATEAGRERWLEIGGYAELGTKQSHPCGEIEVSPATIDRTIAFDAQGTLKIDGELILNGPNIVNAGYLPFVRSSQCRIFEGLSGIDAAAPVRLTIGKGIIRSIDGVHGRPTQGVRMLESILNMDDRYSIVHELGVSLNRELAHLPGNHSYNEMVDDSEDRQGTLHLGLGLLPITQYHFDLFSRGTSIVFA